MYLPPELQQVMMDGNGSYSKSVKAGAIEDNKGKEKDNKGKDNLVR